MEYVRETSVYDEFFEFLLQKFDPEEILAFKASEKAQERMSELMYKNSAGTLSESESNELQQMLQLERVMSVVKARALVKLRKA